MDAAAKSIENLGRTHLPARPYHLSISASAQYQQHPKDTRYEETAIRQLSYMTLLHDVDRGILFTRADYDIHKEPENTKNARSPKLKADPNKPVTKLSLKDYKNRKKGGTPDSNSPPKSNAPLPKPTLDNVKEHPKPPPGDKPEPTPAVAKGMERNSEPKRLLHSLPPKPDLRRPRSPTPERRKRPADGADERPAKRSAVEPSKATNGVRLPPRPETSQKSDRSAAHEKKLPREGKPSTLTNGRSALNDSRGPSPKPTIQVNGSSQKSASSANGTPNKHEAESFPKIAPLLSPLRLSPEAHPSRPSPSKRLPAKETTPTATKHSLKRSNDESMIVPTIKRTKPSPQISPLLSPTLPPEVEEELKRHRRQRGNATPPKEPSQHSECSSTSPASAKKAPAPTGSKEDSIHVDSNNVNGNGTLLVRLRYNKRLTKNIARLLALAPKKKAEVAKKVAPESKTGDGTGHSREESLKRPRATVEERDQPVAAKRPRPSENPHPPSTPEKPKQSAAMQRLASNSSQAATPGAVNGETSAASASSRRQIPHKTDELMKAAKRLKVERDTTSKRSVEHTDHEINLIAAAAVQSTLLYVVAFKNSDDLRDAEHRGRDANLWKSLLPWLKVAKYDCEKHSKEVYALALRLTCITQEALSRSLCSAYSGDASVARDFVQATKDKTQAWVLADEARRQLGVFELRNARDIGPIPKLIDRITPTTSAEEVTAISLDILRKVIRLDGSRFVPNKELAEVADSVARR